MNNNFNKELMSKISTLFLGALGLVAALAWNDAVQALFRVIFKEQSSIIAKFAYAVVITIIVVLVSWKIMKILDKKNQNNKD
ncbi:hypothetical protein KKF32_01275 [Patescibacteria group bacterium]|nr:hypothetical protein [Patescibacteria group bacterium]